MGASSDGDELVAHEVEADAGGALAVKAVGRNGLTYVIAQLLPRIALGEDPFGQTLGDEAAIALLATSKITSDMARE